MNPTRPSEGLSIQTLQRIALVLCAFCIAMPPAMAATFTVNVTGDSWEGVICNHDGICNHHCTNPELAPVCTLRAAIEEANFRPGPDKINFSIGAGPQTIYVNSSVLPIRDTVVIDGTTQPGFTGTPIIEITPVPGGNYMGLQVGSPPQQAPGSVIRGLVLNGFIVAISMWSDGGTIEGNFIGTDLSGTSARQNVRGINLVGVGTVVGGATPAARNVISGNSEGIFAQLGTSSRITGNYIGTDVTGTVPVGNTRFGVSLSGNSSGVRLGGTTGVVPGVCQGECNLIAGNGRFQGEGNIETQGTGNIVEGNFIGTDVSGTVSLGSPDVGIAVWGSESVIGGKTSPARNLISGNGRHGVLCGGTDNRIEGNYIGIAADGTSALGNAGSGVLLYGTRNIIGGSTPGAANVIAGNGSNGVEITGAAATANLIQGNLIGVDKTGVTPLGNLGSGVAIQDATDNVVGMLLSDASPAAAASKGNTISANEQDGVRVLGATALRNSIRGNRIHGNGGMGIDLGGDVVTPNDAGDSDGGPNGLMNFPIGVTAYFDAATDRTTLSGILSAPAPTSTRIDFYASKTPDEFPLSARRRFFGEGEQYLISAVPTAHGVFAVTLSGKLPLPFLSATATNTDGSTSEFSGVCGDPDLSGNPDNDGDGLCDEWEFDGLDTNGDDLADLDLPGLGANPNRKDIFLEIDYMDVGAHDHKPQKKALEAFRAAFAAAPVVNPDSSTGIAVHFLGSSTELIDESVPEIEPVRFKADGAGPADDFNDLKYGNPRNRCGTGLTDGHFGNKADRISPKCPDILDAWSLSVRYGIFGHNQWDSFGSSGIAELPGNDFLVTIGGASPAWFEGTKGKDCKSSETALQCGQREAEAGTLMHEFGHTIGLRHGGSDGVNCKPNYLSVMSYTLQLRDIVADRPLDYSHVALPPPPLAPKINEGALSEPAGIGGSPGRSAVYAVDLGGGACTPPASCKPRRTPSDKPIDWNYDGSATDLGVTADVSAAKPSCLSVGLTELNGFADWPNIKLAFRATPHFSDRAFRAIDDDPELTMEEAFAAASAVDFDEDGLSNAVDNCPAVSNIGQADADDDGIGDACEATLPSLEINDTTVIEGATGSANAVFTVTLSEETGETVTVNWITSDGTAAAPADFLVAGGTLTFPPGILTQTASVPVKGDAQGEPAEMFFVDLDSPSHASISDARGVAIIQNDDATTVTALHPASGPPAGGTEVAVAGTNFQAGASVNIGGAAATGVSVTGPNQLEATTPALPPGTLNDVLVTNPDTSSGVLPRAWLSDFSDVPQAHGFHDFIERLFRAAVTSGCGGGKYCPANSVTRAQMAVFLLRGKHGSDYQPQPATGTAFSDVPAGAFAAAWIEQLAEEGITSGCGSGKYCPNDAVTREQMALFLLKAKLGSDHVPPAPTGIFGDVPVSNPFSKWIEELAGLGITAGCGGGNYCPTSPNTRGQMAVFLVKTFGLP